MLRYLLLSTVIVVGIAIGVAAWVNRDLIRVKIASVYARVPPKPSAALSHAGAPAPAMRGDAPWALSALPECLIQTSESSGSLEYVRAHLPRGAVPIVPPATLVYGDCSIRIAGSEAYVSARSRSPSNPASRAVLPRGGPPCADPRDGAGCRTARVRTGAAMMEDENIQEQVEIAGRLRSSRIPTPARRRSPRSCCSTAARFTAGQVSARKRQRQATTDWMALERERGISITSTVLQFPYHGYTINLLDTPGHQDFGEDTYRTLLAADSAVMLIDAAKGVEPQTRKLFAICRARRIPLFTFINKTGPAEPRSARTARRTRERARHRRLSDELAARQRRDVPRRVRSRHARGAPVRTHRARREARTGLGGRRHDEAARAGRASRTYAPVSRRDRAARRRGRDVRSRGDAARRRDAGVLRQRGDELRRAALPRPVRRDGSGAEPRRRAGASIQATTSTSPASSSRFRPTWIRAIAIASRSCASARASSSAT